MTKSKNSNLHKARKLKCDEFYTTLSDIEKELKHYKDYFRDKIVLCNCDDPRISNFFKYFSYNFEFLGLKKLITTCYKNQQIDLFTQHIDEKAIYLEYTGDKNDNRVPDSNEVDIKNLKGDGDFRSKECIELLKEADVVVSNPPFSLWREYMAQLIEYEKQFLIVGSLNAVTYKEIFPLIKDNKIWLGHNNGAKEFNNNVGNIVKFGNIGWFTNLETKKRYEDLILYKKYYGNEAEYPKYDNYDAINIDKTKDIPCDYYSNMGVPISFLDKYNPEQFEISALGNSRENFTPNKDYINPKKHTKDDRIVNGNAINCVLTIETDKKPYGIVYYTSNNSKYLVPPYARILIKRKTNI